MKPEKARKLHFRAICVTAAFVAGLIIAGNASPPFHPSSVTDLPSTRGNPRDAALDDPIHIVGDAGWQAAKAAGNCTGDGTPADPYVISGKIIDAGGVTSGIWIENSTAHFRVQDCRVNRSAAAPAAGIYLVNASNAVLMGNNCTNNEGPGILVSKLCENVDVISNNVSQNTLGYGVVISDRCVNVTIEGNEASFNGDGIIINSFCNDTIIRGNNIHGNPFEGVLVNVYCNNVTIEDNDIADNRNNGVHVFNSYFPVIRGNNCTGSGWHGIYLEAACHNATIENNFATGNTRHGVFVAGGSRNATVVGNNASANMWSGIALFVGSNGSLVCNNSLGGNAGGNARDDSNFSRWDDGSRGNFWANYTGIDGNDDGIGDSAWAIPGTAGSQDRFPIWDDGDHTILINGDAGWAAFRAAGNCTGSGTAGDPYVISSKQIDATAETSNIWVENSTCQFVIQDCTLTNPGTIPHAAIRVANASNGLITGNNCTAGSLGSGILLGGNSTNITIQHNSISGCGYGIVLWQRCDNITVKWNTVYANLNTGIAVSNVTQTLVENNTATWNGNAGIQVVQTSANNTVQGNLVAWNTQWGIVLAANAQNNTVKGNNVTGNFKVGIILAGGDPVENNTINDNDIVANQWNGILLESGATKNNFTGNTILGNGMSGANLSAGCNGNWFMGNNFTGNVLFNAQDDGTGNHWDNGTRGNYWADNAGVDLDDDRIGDSAYGITGTAGAQDNHPTWDDGDDVASVITGTGLLDDQLCGPAAPEFFLVITEAYAVNTAWVSYDGGAHNWTCGETGTLPAWTSLANGSVTAIFWANDTAGHVATGVTVTLRKDSLAPLLDVRQVLPFCDVECDSPTFDVNATDAQLDRTWYTLGNDPARYYFTGRIVTIDTAAWAALPAGEVTITFHANDTLGNEQVVTKIVTKQPAGGDLGLYLAIGGGIALAVVAGVIILQQQRKRRARAPG